jgi:hypothetical protein
VRPNVTQTHQSRRPQNGRRAEEATGRRSRRAVHDAAISARRRGGRWDTAKKRAQPPSIGVETPPLLPSEAISSDSSWGFLAIRKVAIPAKSSLFCRRVDAPSRRHAGAARQLARWPPRARLTAAHALRLALRNPTHEPDACTLHQMLTAAVGLKLAWLTARSSPKPVFRHNSVFIRLS